MIEPSCEFSWDELALRVGDCQIDERPEAWEALQRVMDWLLEGHHPSRRVNERRVARRIYSLAWVMGRPEFENKSLAQLARLFGVTPPVLTHHAVAITRRWGLQNWKQCRGWNSKAHEKVDPRPN